MQRTKSFTLLEIFLSLTLIISIGTLLTTQGVRWLNKKTLDTAEKKCLEIFTFCHYMAHTKEKDIVCHIQEDGKKIKIFAFFAKDHTPVTTATLDNISLEDEVELLFPERGGIITDVPLIFSQKKEEKLIDISSIGLCDLDL